MQYWYYPNPRITKLIPSRGPLSGGNEVLIEGLDLDPFNDMLKEVNNHKHTIVQFGPHYKSEAKIYSDTLISVVAPPSLTIQSVFIDITLNNADLALNPQDWTDDFLEYSYYALADIFDIEPRRGPIAGSTMIYATGNFYNASSAYTFEFGEGSDRVVGEYISSSSVRVYSPSVKAAGFVNLTMYIDDELYGKAVEYEYYDVA